MNKIVIKTTIGFLSLGLIVVGAQNFNNYHIKQDSQLNYVGKKAQNSSSGTKVSQVKKQAEENVSVDEKELSEAKEVQEKAEKEVKKAEEAISKASKVKEKALVDLQNAKTTEEKKAAQAKIEEATKEINQAQEAKKSAEKKVEEAAKTVEQKSQNKQKQTVSNTTSQSNSTATNNNTQSTTNKNKSTTQNNTTTNQKETESEQGPKFDLSKYEEIQKQINEQIEQEKKRMEEEAQKKTVNFHFYTTTKTLTVRCNDESCGEGKQGYIWFVEFECDLNKCEGFDAPGTGLKKGDVFIGRRGDITEYTMEPPAAKYGYKFVAWELISANKNRITINGDEGLQIAKYVAVYEKI